MQVTDYRGLTIHYNDTDELKTLLEETFKHNSYYVDLETSTPRIIDAGAHIGVPALYFHSLYPHAKMLLFEPNPANLELLRLNLEANNVTDAVVLPKALVGKTPHHTLYTNSRWTVFSSLLPGGWTGDEASEPIEVETTPLLPYLAEPIDLLKMDIEGMETEVIEAAREGLRNVAHLILEFHRTKTHTEDRMLKILNPYFGTIEVTEDQRHERDRHNQLLMIEAHK